VEESQALVQQDPMVLEGEVLLDNAELELLENDLHYFMVESWRSIEPGRPFHDNWHLEAVCDHLQAVSEGQIRNLVINIPPRHLKSMTVQVFWPAWTWAKRPHIKWLCVAYNRNLVIRDAAKCRRLMASPWYQKRWGNKFNFSEDQNAKYHYENDQGGVRLIGSFEGGVTGEGGDILVVDDPTQLDDSENQNALEHARDMWDGTFATRLNDPATASRVIIMQRLNENDLTGHVLKEGGWTHLYLPTEFEAKRRCVTYLSKWYDEDTGVLKSDAEPFFMDPRTEEGELLDPGRFDKRTVAVLRSKGDTHYAGQQQQNPSPAGGTIFKRSWFKHYENLPPGLETYQDACISLDCSFKDTKGSDYVVMSAWARKYTDIYLLGRVRKRLDFPNTIKEFETFCEIFPWIGAKYVEDKANGPAVISSLTSQIPGLIPVNPEGGKVVRAHAVTYLYQAGNVHHPSKDRASWIVEWEDELARFPKGSYDDQVDSATQALFHHFHLRPPQEFTLLDLLAVGKDEPMMSDEARVM
jgi:predicted phage terminase large subunit-like protein